ncbi:MAG: aminotransferase class I/II-fold pyridoxal phosphate-dependent enzyme [Thermoflexales bacterium]|nr:aminotransferase class I/II-fold pyridoxal phosphate-dependent enzyme [Thermoflexales bacterium]
MQINPFKLERYFARYEFNVKYLLSPSDCESMPMSELLQMADPASLSLWNELRLGYTESPGHPLLRAEAACLYQTIDADHVMIAAPEEAIFIAMHTLLKPGDHIVSVFPAYQSLYEIARAIGCEVTPWTFELGPSGWRLDLDHLEGLLTDHTRLLVLNFPHNPTGYLPSRSELDSIVEAARKRGLYIFCDEMYRFLEYDPARRLPAMCDLYEKGISLSGLSKSFALPGLRLGWLATQERALLERWLTFKDYTTICHSAPSEILGIMALRAKEGIVARNLGIIQGNLKIAERFFAEHADWLAWIEPQAGPITFPRWTGDISVEQFCQAVLEQQSVMIVPGSLFDFPGNHFRLGLGRKNLGEALERVGACLSSFGGGAILRIAGDYFLV